MEGSGVGLVDEKALIHTLLARGRYLTPSLCTDIDFSTRVPIRQLDTEQDRAIANFVNLPQGDAHSLSMMAEDPELRGFQSVS